MRNISIIISLTATLAGCVTDSAASQTAQKSTTVNLTRRLQNHWA
jgi:hypothetical protein